MTGVQEGLSRLEVGYLTLREIIVNSIIAVKFGVTDGGTGTGTGCCGIEVLG